MASSNDPDESKQQSHSTNIHGDANIENGDLVARDKRETHAEIYIEHYQGPLPPPVSSTNLAPAEGEPPYRGMLAFREEHAGSFFGREDLTARLVRALEQQRLLIVVGASGSGKSSLVQAGMIASLRQGKPLADGSLPPAGSSDWDIHLIRPGAHPLEALAASLTRRSKALLDTAKSIDELGQDQRSFHLAAQRIVVEQNSERLLLVVDQFEEVFTLCKDDAEREAFVNGLLYAVREDVSGPALVVITLRADFYQPCFRYPLLRQALETSQITVAPMTHDELRRAIENPARAGGWELEDGLVKQLLEDTVDEPGALPLLATALRETWENREGRTLTLAGYRKTGGVREVIAKKADSVLAGWTESQQKIARRIFVSLTQLGEGAPDTRRRAGLEELLRAGDEAQIQEILNRLSKERLIIVEEAHAEVAHEALIREWEQLRKWLEFDRDDERIRRRLAQDAEEWHKRGRDPNELYRGARLAQAEEWVKRHPSQRRTTDLAFLNAATSERRAGERRRRWFMVLLFAVAILLAGLGLWGNAQRIKAEEESVASLSRQLVVQANNVALQKPSGTRESILLLIESYQRYPDNFTVEALRKSLASIPKLVARNYLSSGYSIEGISRDGRYLALLYDRHTVLVWDRVSEKEVFQIQNDATVYDVVFSEDNTHLAYDTIDSVHVWSIERQSQIQTLPDSNVNAVSRTGKYIFVEVGYPNIQIIELATGKELRREISVDFSPKISTSSDEQLYAFFDVNGTLHIRKILDGEDVLRLPQIVDGTAAVFSPDNKSIAIGSVDGSVQVLDIETGQEIAALEQEGGFYDLIFSHDGKKLITIGYAITTIWDIESGQQIIRSPEFATGAAMTSDDQYLILYLPFGPFSVWQAAKGEEMEVSHAGPIFRAAYHPSGRYIVSGGHDRTVRVWDTVTGREVTHVTHDKGINSIFLSPDGHLVASGSDDGMVKVWSTMDGADVLLKYRHNQAVKTAVFHPDGNLVASGSVDGTIFLRNIETNIETKRMAHDDDVNTLAFSPDGTYLVSGGCDQTVRLWETATGKEVWRAYHDGDGTSQVLNVAFSPDGKSVISGGEDDTARVWDAKTGEQIAQVTHAHNVFRVAFSPDGKSVLSAGADGLLQVWDPLTGSSLAQFNHENRSGIFTASFHPDGKHVISASDDGTARIWDIDSGKEAARMTHPKQVFRAGFSPDGVFAYSADDVGSLVIWRWRAEDLIAEACARLSGNLTQNEWDTYFPDNVPYHVTCPNLPAGQ